MGDPLDRRRTGFERDLREFVLKFVVGLLVGLVLTIVIETPMQWWIPWALGQLAVFGFAALIAGSSRHQDDR